MLSETEFAFLNVEQVSNFVRFWYQRLSED